jgi:hypothetical protein
MNDEPFWMKPKIVELSDGTEVTLRPEVESDLELTLEMFCSYSLMRLWSIFPSQSHGNVSRAGSRTSITVRLYLS